MTDSADDPERIPVVVASGQSIERNELVTPVDLMERAAESAFADVPALRSRVERLSVVNILTRTGPAPASELAERIGTSRARCEVTTIGGNSPQWLVNRAADDIAAGSLSVTVIAGAEALRSSRQRRARSLPREIAGTRSPADPVVGDDLPGVGPAEMAAGLLVPIHIYPLFESVVANRLGNDSPAHRELIGRFLAPFTKTAAANPYAWFPEVRTADEIATPSADNRIVCDPYTKRMSAFLGSDQGAVVVVCSLAAARAAGVADRSVFVWSGAEATDVRFPTARPDPGRSPAIAAAGRAVFEAASETAGTSGGIGIDDVELLDIYSCFPSAVELAADALGLGVDDSRGLTVTGGLPYFGGPGNNYATHAIATLTDALRGSAPVPNGSTGPAGSRRLGLVTGLGWFVTKHALGLYGDVPPPHGFRRADTAAAQSEIDDSAREVALEIGEAMPATVIAATVVRGDDGTPTGAPLIARLPDGRHMALAAADEEAVDEAGTMDVARTVGSTVVVQSGAPRYRLRVA